MVGRASAALFLAGALALGCRAPAASAIPEFRQAVATAAQHTADAFAEINDMLREQQLERAASAATLSEELFAEGVPAEALATWDRAFAEIEAYAGKIEELLDPERGQGVEEELRGLGAELGEVRGEAVPPGVGAAFIQLGGLLVDLRAEEKALEILRETDGAVRDVFETMAMAIGSTHEEGVRLTVWSAWTTNLGKLQVAFLETEEADKREVAEAYLDMLSSREAHDVALGALRSSLLALAKAHAHLAAGERRGAAGLLALVEREYADWKAEKQVLGDEE